MGLFLTRCPKCRRRLAKNAHFCECGEPAGDLRRICTHCHRVIEADCTLCPHCGVAQEEVAASYALIRWARHGDEAARRIAVGDLRGALDGGVVVDHGTRAVLLLDGAIRQVLEPGWTSTAKDPLSVYAGDEYVHRFEVVGLAAGELPMAWRISGPTADPLPCSAEVKVTVAIGDPAAFLTNCLRARESLGIHDLAEMLLPEIRASVTGRLGATPMDQVLAPDGAGRQAFEAGLREDLNRALAARGLCLERLRDLRVFGEAPEEILKGRAKAAAAEERVQSLERYLATLREKGRLEDSTWAELKKSKLLSEAEIRGLEADIRRQEEDAELGWRKVHDLLEVRLESEIRAIKRQDRVADQEAEIELEEKGLVAKEAGKIARLEAEAKIAEQLLRARGERETQWAEKLRGMNAEQMTALAARFSPDVAAAMGERFKAAAEADKAGLLLEMQERLMKLLESSHRSQAETAETNADRLAGVQKGAMEGMSRVASAKAGGTFPRCPSCGQETRPGDAFCANCGAKLRQGD